jgi:hypothetical protein
MLILAVGAGVIMEILILMRRKMLIQLIMLLYDDPEQKMKEGDEDVNSIFDSKVMAVMVILIMKFVEMAKIMTTIVISNADGCGGDFDVGNVNDKAGNCTCRMIVGVGCS